MSTAATHRALFLKNLTFQKRQVKTNVCQIVWVTLQMILLIYMSNVSLGNYSQDPDLWSNNNTDFQTISPYSLNFSSYYDPTNYAYEDADSWFSNIVYSDPDNVASELVANLQGAQGHYFRNSSASSSFSGAIVMNVPLPNLISMNDSSIDTYYRETYKEYSDANYTTQIQYSIHVPTAGIEFEELSTTSVKYNLKIPIYDYSMGYTVNNYIETNENLLQFMFTTILNGILKSNTTLNTTIYASSQEFPYVQFPMSPQQFLTFLSGMFGLFFIPSVVIFILPVFVFTVVSEKQEKLSEMMKMMGISMGTMWLSNYMFCVCLSLIVNFVVIILGYIGGVGMFKGNSPAAILLLFIMFSFAQVSFAFVLSCFFSKARTSVLISYFLVMIFNGLGASLQMSAYKTSPAPFLLMIFPPFTLQRGVYLLTYNVTGAAPHDLVSLSVYSQLSEVIMYLFCEAIIYFFLTIYLDFVIPRENGVTYSPFFPITAAIKFVRRYKRFDGFERLDETKFISEEKKPEEAQPATAIDDLEQTNIELEDEDCVRERRRVHAPGEFMVKIVDLHKTYPGRGGQPAKNALVKFCLALEKGECLGLLGPNGAGKTSLISMLCGLSVPTSGNAFISGFNIKTEMYEVHKILGYCPQHDILWPDLTIEEHLLFYCRLKGYDAKSEVSHVREIATGVGLGDHLGKKVSELSGGMKRRLSISIALVGDSRLVLLDEPTTGLDPDTRRVVWDIINSHKATRSIIITTHNIDEADVLCSKIAIMSLGSLKCIGSALYLKNKFGAGYKLSAHVRPGAEDNYKEWVRSKFQQAEQDPASGTIDFIIPAQDMDVSYVFSMMKRNKDELGILEWAINQMSLEEVFLKMVAQDESQF